MTNDDLRARLSKPRFPRSAGYDPRWAIDNQMGPNVLWLAEYLCEALVLAPGMRVLDLGCGKAISSIFLAREFGVSVVAADLWIKPDENQRRIEAAGVSHLVTPVYAEAHALPFAEDAFDAIVSLDAYHYFGTDDLYLGTILKFLKRGGRLGIVVPGVQREIEVPPTSLKPWWEWEFCSFHSPNWWRRHWAKTGLASIENSDWMEDGHALWLEWCRISAPLIGARGESMASEGDMLEADTEGLLGFVRAIARRD
jgi:cyclopropane fatty-acyl-phospholipid synthase-like methyltransferase